LNPPDKNKKRVNIHRISSSLPGLGGFLENNFRRFRSIGLIVAISPIAIFILLGFATSLLPGIYLFHFVNDLTVSWPQPLHFMALGLSFALGFLLYALSSILVFPLLNFLIPFKPKPWRGSWFSLGALPWYYHNAFNYMVRYTVLDLITPSPLTMLYYRLMGMKMGKGVMINSTNISDPCMITLGDNVTIGGSATLLAHYGQKGYLVIDR